MKKAPVSGVESLMDYRASADRRAPQRRHRDVGEGGRAGHQPVPLLARRSPSYGAHNQRSHVTISARLREHMWIEELIDIAE